MTSNNTLYGNRQQPQTLTGRQGVQQPQQGQPQQNSQQQPANLLQQMSGAVARLTGAMNNGGGNNGSIYNFNTNNGYNFQALMGLDDNMAEEQIKNNALNEAASLSNQILQVCARRNANHPAYQQVRQAMERFKSPRRNTPQDPALVGFVNEMDSNQNLYSVVLMNGCLVFAARWAQMLTQDDTVRQNNSKFKETIYTSFVDTINFQYLDYLANHPNGAQVYYQFSPILKEHLVTFEAGNYENILAGFVYAGQQCPWRKGRIEEITARVNVSNPLIDVADPLDLGYGGVFHNPNDFSTVMPGSNIDNSVVGTIRDPSMQEFLMRQRQHYAGEQAQQHHEHQLQSEIYNNVSYNDVDAKPLELWNMTAENRLRYTVDMFAVQVPGTEFWIASPEKLKFVLPFLRLSNGEKVDYAEIAYIWRGELVYRFDWQNGLFDFRKIDIPDRKVNHLMLLSNPEKLLPYMYVEDGVQKTTFDPTVFEFDKFANDGNVVLDEMKALGKEPDVLIASAPVTLEGDNDDTVGRLDHAVDMFKGKRRMDAFVLPALLGSHLEFTNIEEEEAIQFYTDFAPMVHGAYQREGYSDTARVIRAIKAAYQKTDQHEIGNFFRDYITSLVNRWLVECRGYSESKAEFDRTGTPRVVANNIFAELDELLEYLQQNDQASLRAFLDYETNWFIRTGLEIMVPFQEAKAMNKKRLESYIQDENDGLSIAIAKKMQHRRIIFRRETLLVSMTKVDAPATLDKVIVKESLNPELFAVIRKARTITSKHFDDQAQLLVKFGNSPQVWSLTPSDMDKESVMTMRSLYSDQPYAQPLSIFEANGNQ